MLWCAVILFTTNVRSDYDFRKDAWSIILKLSMDNQIIAISHGSLGLCPHQE